MNPIKRLAGQTMIYGLSSIIGRLLNYLLVPLYTRVFLPAEYGVITEMYAYVALFFVVLTYGMETAYFRFSQDEKSSRVYSTSIISLLITSGGFILLATLFSGSIADSLGYYHNPEYITWFAIIIGLDAFTAIPFARLRQENRPLLFAALKLISIGSNIFFNLFFLIFCPYLIHHLSPDSFVVRVISMVYDPSVGVGYVFISNLISSILTLFLFIPQFRDINWKFDYVFWRRMLVYALPLLIMGMAGTINATFDRIMLKYLLPDQSTAMAQLGIYGACYKLSILMTLFVQTFRFAAEPFFFAEFKNQDAKLTYARVMNYFMIICVLIFLSVMVYIDIVKHFVGPAYYPGLKVVPILLIANLFLGVFYNLSIWYKLTNRTLFGAYVAVFGTTLTLVMNYFLIPVIGYVGSAWSAFACYGSMMVLSYWLGQKYYPINYNLKKFLGYLGFSVLLYALSEITHTSHPYVNYAMGTLYLMIFIIPVYFIEKHDFVRQRA
ncbi:MAG: oligosaccharide flippase family protein [Bacteroidetes bacterium]|nr:oligosaccharide flippase family protein [Bacteroidota bacterium]